MASNKVANPKASIKPNDNAFNDRDRINDLLISYKHLSYMYSLACQEASNPKLYKAFLALFHEVSEMQRATYYLMFEKGWNALEKQSQEKIKQSHKMFKQQESQLH